MILMGTATTPSVVVYCIIFAVFFTSESRFRVSSHCVHVDFVKHTP